MSPPGTHRIDSRSQARGLLLGLALGDAVGRPVEFLGLEEIRDRFGPRGVFEPEGPLRPTDDTSMSLAVVAALVAAGGEGPEALMEAVVREFVDWRRRVRPEDAPGATCLEATARLEAGTPWAQAGLRWSKGAGAVMRAAPVGYYFRRHPRLLREVSRMIARITHGHPTAAAGAVAAAAITRAALDREPPEVWIDRAARAYSGLPSGELTESFRKIEGAMAAESDTRAMEAVGEGWVAEEAVAMAVAASLRHPDDFKAAVRCAVNHGGDSDTVGCVTGAFLGARLGESGLPEDWIERLDDRSALIDAADRLGAARDALR